MAFFVYSRQPGLSLMAASETGAEQFERMNNSSMARDLGPLNAAGNITNVSSLFFFMTFVVYVVYYLIKNLPVLAPLKLFITIVWKMLCTKKKKVAPDAEGTDGDLPCFSDALKGCNHEQLRVLSDSAKTIVGPEALAPKERQCLNVNDIFFKMWGLKKDAPKIDVDTWKAAQPLFVHINGLGKTSYNLRENPFYADAFKGDDRPATGVATPAKPPKEEA